MRIRSVKPEYWQHGMHEVLSREASILAPALLNFADDDGRGDATPTKIQGLVVPCVPMDIPKVLRELEAINFLTLYEVQVEGMRRRLFQVVTFARHQSISHPTPSVLPPPPGWVFRLDAKPEGWSDKKGKWRRGKWFRLSDELTPGGLPEDSRNELGASPSSYLEAVQVGSGGDSNLARARTGTGKDKDKDREGECARTRGEGLTDGEVGLLGASASEMGKKNGAVSRGDAEGAEAVIPTEGEVLKVCEVDGVEAGYGARFWRSMTNDHGWVKNGRLRRWRNILADRWGQDRGAWLEGRMAGSPFRNALAGAGVAGGGTGNVPAWRRMEGLKRAILEHPANAKGAMYEPRCSRAQKAGLAALEEELAAMEGVSRGGAEGAEGAEKEPVAA